MLFSLEKDDNYSADFLLATLTTPSSQETPSSAASVSHRESGQRNSPISVVRNQTTMSKSISRTLNSPSISSRTPEHPSRLNSLSLLDVNPPGPLSSETVPPPAKRVRARYIFQRCLQSSQDVHTNLGQVLAPDSDSEI